MIQNDKTAAIHHGETRASDGKKGNEDTKAGITFMHVHPHQSPISHTLEHATASRVSPQPQDRSSTKSNEAASQANTPEADHRNERESAFRRRTSVGSEASTTAARGLGAFCPVRDGDVDGESRGDWVRGWKRIGIGVDEQ